MGVFGWSLPPGCRTLPGEDDEGPIALKCKKCGCFVPLTPCHFEPWKDTVLYKEPFGDKEEKLVTIAAGVEEFHYCKHCDELVIPISVFRA